ncbi:MAG TPA: hypothetical protein VFB63_10295 [Bryobacteraceae bacterium]|nr:hypothetical protein [Bryobacteraceae bacterium]
MNATAAKIEQFERHISGRSAHFIEIRVSQTRTTRAPASARDASAQ